MMLGGDIQVKWSAAEQSADFVFDEEDIDLSTDAGLETAIVISLFTDRRADGEALPSGETKLKGWWGDCLSDVDGDKIGSKLWLLYREKHVSEVASRAKEYAEESLRWLTDTRVAKRIEVEAYLLPDGVLALSAKILRPEVNDVAEFRFNYNWQAQEVYGNAL